MRSKILQLKLIVDMLLICMILFSEFPIELKIIVGLLGFDYTMMCSERIANLQEEEK